MITTAIPIGSRQTFERLPGGGYAFTLVDDAVRIEVRHLRRESRQLHAEVDVQCQWAGVRRHHGSLSCADMNLSSQVTRKSLAKYCGERARTKPDEFDWMGAIDAACLETIAAEREGAPVIVLDDAPIMPASDVDVYGLQIPTDSASMLIAHGDSLKSLLLLLILGTLATRGIRVLYLDYEWTAERHAQRKRRLFGPDRLDALRYVRCRAPLTVEADSLRRYCAEHAISFLGVDSVGLACDGKLSDDDTAIRFHRALGSLPPSMSAAHVPKSSLGPDGKGDAVGPFGSVFFSNLCRETWLVKKQETASDDVVTVGCFVQKQNDGSRHRPVGLQFTFSSEQIAVEPVAVAGVEGFADKVSLASRMVHLLRGSPPQTYAAMAETLGAKLDSVMRVVARTDRFTKVAGVDGITKIALMERYRVES